jgi:hypothetical protein
MIAALRSPVAIGSLFLGRGTRRFSLISNFTPVLVLLLND